MLEFILLIWLGVQALSEEQKQQRSLQITKWAKDLAQQGILITTHSFWDYGYTIHRMEGSSKRYVTGVASTESDEGVSAYMIIHAKSIQEAVEIAKKHPGIDYGGIVEVREMRGAAHAQKK